MSHLIRSLRIPILAIVLLLSRCLGDSLAQELDVWIGTGGKPSQGIYHSILDTTSGKISESKLVAEMNGPGFLAMHPKLPVLYAVGGLSSEQVVASFQIVQTGKNASLKFVSSQPIGDGGATHLSVSSNGKTLITAQYGGGSVAVFALADDGAVSKRTQLIKHSGGSKAVPGRQDSSHAHWAGFSPDQKFAFVPDLGLDQVVIYRADTATATLTAHGFGQTAAGAGPRHMKFHNNGKWIYVLNELDYTVSLFDWDSQAGTMSLRQTVPTIAKDELDRLQFKSCSEIRVHPNGKFVYAANRGHDSITVFQVAEDGKLSSIQVEPVRGATPRNFNLDPTGKWLLAGGQDSHTLACFVVDESTGRITYNRSIISTPSPICVLFKPE
ncbi:MAG: lactonase family protein [Pirellulales bacterium]